MIKNDEPSAASAATVDPAINSLPLFYKAPVVLNVEQHGNCGLADSNSFAFAREAIAVPLDMSEFVPVVRDYPIVFSDAEQPTPLAVLGFKQNQNLFLEEDDTWRADRYIPAYVRRYPFIVTEISAENRQLLAIDTASERFIPSVSDEQMSRRLFNDDSAPTELAQAAINFCNAFHQEHLRTIEFCQALKDAKLLVANHADMQLPDGTRYTLNGFRVIDEKIFRELPADTLSEWNKKGWLDFVILHFASRQNWQTLLDLNALRAQAQNA
ncbi:SapC family protein [Achromobacter seleniivolatilans]|uniref:SapC family protein n=1 Tax=Achromobacter seleniivolatilans TaxID=3047478 RepID=A0ABY9M0Z4_9BURK|nr:SapC family protein [Achromobacter sp. R39]WMD20686.1 SapC family protein [Achromobacter sp. R39]